jgi:hypothetical protein
MGQDFDADTAGWQDAIDYAASLGGGIVRGDTNAEYWIRNLVISTDNIVLDFAGATVVADPTTSGANGSPMVYAGGVRGSPSAVVTVSKGAYAVTVDTGEGVNFTPGMDVVLADTKFIPPWDYGSGNPNIGPGYNVRRELHVVRSVAGDVVTLQGVVERDYDAAEDATLTPVALLERPVVRNIANGSEIDPGAAFSGTIDDLANAPHIVAMELCRGGIIENVNFDGFQLHIATQRECADTIARFNTGANPFRPSTSGHGYVTRADRCRNAGSACNTGLVCRHVFDDVQSIDSLSLRNVGRATAGATIAFHGHGALRGVSQDDCDIGSSASIGFFVGNPSFSGDYGTRIINFRGSGGTARGYVACLSEDTEVINISSDGCTSRDVLIVAGAKRTRVIGGNMAAGPGCTNAIFSRDKVSATDSFGIPCEDITVAGLAVDMTTGDSAQVGIELDCIGDAIVRDVDLTIGSAINDGVRIGLNNTPDRVLVSGVTGRGAGVGNDIVRVFTAPTGAYVVTGVNDRDAARNLRLAVSDSLVAIHNNFAGSWVLDGDELAAVAGGAIIRDNTPSAGEELDRVPQKIIDLLVSKGIVIASSGTDQATVTFGWASDPDRPSAYTPLANMRVHPNGDIEITTRNSNGTGKASVAYCVWATGLWFIAGVPQYVGVPASATATGTAGQVAYDASYVYVCTAANTWKRAAIAGGF